MKTKRSARRMAKVRRTVICLALVGMVGVAFWLGQSLGAQVRPPTAPQTQVPQAPKGSLGDLIAAAW